MSPFESLAQPGGLRGLVPGVVEELDDVSAKAFAMLANVMGGDSVPYDGSFDVPPGTLPATENPYFDLVTSLPGSLGRPGAWSPGPLYVQGNNLITRDACVSRYGWSIPAPATLAWLLEVLEGRPLIDVGAGLGYWAWQLRQLGVQVHAFDLHTPAENPWARDVQPWTQVEAGSTELLGDPSLADEVLLLNWPPRTGTMGVDALTHFQGDTVVHVGEIGGATGEPGFSDTLERHWRAVTHGPLMSWATMWDSITLYERR